MNEPLVAAATAIYDAVRSNAAPITVEYALTKVDRIWLDSDLLIDLFAALNLASEKPA